MSQVECAQMPDTIPSFLRQSDLKLVLFGGKGGVGKTTCAAAAGLHLAGQFPDRTYLIASTDPAHSLQDSFAGSLLPHNLELREIDSRESLRRFKEAHGRHLRQIALRGTFLDDGDVGRLLELSIPGLDEIMAFMEIADLVESRAYSCILVDTAATGHTLRFLALPEALRKWVSVLDAMLAKHRYLAGLYRGFYRKDEANLFLEGLSRSIERLASVLTDPRSCRFVPVALPEPMVIAETRRLVDQLEKWKVPVSDLLVNRLHPSANGCRVCREVLLRQRMQLRRLGGAFSGYSLWEVPLQGAEVRGAEKLAAFWNGLRPVRMLEEQAYVSTLQPAVERPARLPAADIVLLLFAGKGGVGKTTLAAATAFRLCETYRGKKVFLFSTDPANSLSDCLAMPIGPRAVAASSGLTAMEIDAEAEFQKLKSKYAEEAGKFFHALAKGKNIDLEFDREVVERLMDLSPPGLDEVMALTRVVEFLEAGTYDIFVLDAAPTGHLIRLLELPALIQDWLKVFFGIFLKYRNTIRLPGIVEFMVELSKKLKVFRLILADPRKGQACAVSILTEMAFAETQDLLASCGQAGVHVPTLFLNMATPLTNCSLCSAMARNESAMRARFAATFKDLRQPLVYRCGLPLGPERLAELGRLLYLN